MNCSVSDTGKLIAAPEYDTTHGQRLFIVTRKVLAIRQIIKPPFRHIGCRVFTEGAGEFDLAITPEQFNDLFERALERIFQDRIV